jgi:hypothetical protein
MNLENYNPSDRLITENAQAMYLGWELVTKSSTRSVLEKVDRDSLRAMENATLQTDDLTGDSSAAAFAGPAIDAEALVFHMRLLPLAVGYKTTLTTLPFLLGYGTPKPAELVVSGVEPVQTVAGKFNCYKLSFASLGQTFWIGVDGARPLVKFQSAKVEAELVKVWGPTVFNDALSFLKTAGWLPKNLTTDRGGPTGYAFAASPANSPFQQLGVHVEMRRIYTPAAEIEPALQRACPDRAKELSSDSQERSVRPGSIRTVRFGSYPAVSCVIDLPSPSKSGEFDLWVASNSLILRFHRDVDRDLPVFLWMFEPVLNGIKLP